MTVSGVRITEVLAADEIEQLMLGRSEIGQLPLVNLLYQNVNRAAVRRLCRRCHGRPRG